MTKSKLKELWELEERATKGPWFAEGEEYYDQSEWKRHWKDEERPRFTVSPDKGKAGWCTDSGHDRYCIYEADAKLIAASRNMLPKLRAFVEAFDRHAARIQAIDDPINRKLREARAALDEEEI